MASFEIIKGEMLQKIQDTLRKIPAGIRNALIIAVLFIAMAILLFYIYGNSFFVLTILFLIGSISLIYKRWYKGIPFGIEQVTMTTFVVGKAFGPWAGMIFGVITAITGQYILGDDYDADAIPFFIGVAIVGFIAAFLPFTNIISVGICSLIVGISTAFLDFMRIEQRFAGILYVLSHLMLTSSLWMPLGSYLLKLASAP